MKKSLVFCMTLSRTVRVGLGIDCDLRGFSEKIIDALQSVSKTPDEEAEFKFLQESGLDDAVRDHYLSFIKRAKANEIGRKVKVADIKDNLDISRIEHLIVRDMVRLERYKAALNILIKW